MAALVRTACRLSRSNCNYHVIGAQQTFNQRRGVRTLFRTKETDPANHSLNNEGLFYTVPEDFYRTCIGKGLSVDFTNATKAFNERALMVRKPGLEIIDNLKKIDYKLPVVRQILYGRNGAGKTVSLAHVLHYCHTQNWLLVYVPWAPYYNRYYKELEPSAWKPDRFDQPLEAAEWLANFLAMNGDLIREKDMRIKNKYVWSKREFAEIDTPFPEVIDFAMARVKYASDVMGAILKEIKLQASEDNKVLVAIDGINSFWSETTKKRGWPAKGFHPASSLTIVHQLKKIIKNDWSGGAVVATVDPNVNINPEDRAEYTPLKLLGSEGFEFVDPHIPIHVPFYSDKEIRSAIEYYKDRKWITHPAAETDDGKNELIFLSSNSPLELYSITRRW